MSMIGRSLRRLPSWALIAALAGCAAFPSQVRMPTAATVAADLEQYSGVYPVQSNRGAAIEQARKYLATWRHAQEDFALNRDFNSNLGVIASIGAAISGVQGNVHDAKVGAALAGGSALYSSTYRPASLSEIYGKGADAMECIMTNLQGLSPAIDMLYENGSLRVQQLDLGSDADAQVAWGKLQSLWLDVNLAMSSVAGKLRTNAITQTIAAPSVSELETKLRATIKEQEDAPKQAAAAQAKLLPSEDERVALLTVAPQAEQASSPARASTAEQAKAAAALETRKRLAAKAQAKIDWAGVPESAKAYAISLGSRLQACSNAAGR